MPDRPADPPLKLLALDAEDLAVLSAHLQDFVVKVGDLAWLPGEGRFAFIGNRADRRHDGKVLRRRAAGHFGPRHRQSPPAGSTVPRPEPC